MSVRYRCFRCDVLWNCGPDSTDCWSCGQPGSRAAVWPTMPSAHEHNTRVERAYVAGVSIPID